MSNHKLAMSGEEGYCEVLQRMQAAKNSCMLWSQLIACMGTRILLIHNNGYQWTYFTKLSHPGLDWSHEGVNDEH